MYYESKVEQVQNNHLIKIHFIY